MKKMISLALLLCAVTTFAQVSTTTEEYNYLTKGYPEQLLKGGDMKAGYTLIPQFEKDSENKSFHINVAKLKETSSGQVKAISVVLSKKDEKKRYLCIPINNKELSQKFMDEVNGLGLSMGMFMEYSIYKNYAELLAGN